MPILHASILTALSLCNYCHSPYEKVARKVYRREVSMGVFFLLCGTYGRLQNVSK